MPVRIVTDNCCDLPQEILDKYKIPQVHMMVRFGSEEYLPENLDLKWFYEQMRVRPEPPTTSQPLVEEMTRVYEEALSDGAEVIVIQLSSQLSGTYQSALMIRDNIPGKERLHIVDSRRASISEGLCVLEAVRMAEEGRSAAEILARLDQMGRSVTGVFTPHSLTYLVKGGRLSKASGLLGTMLDIKPLITFDKIGGLEPLEKVRGRRPAVKRMLKMVEENAHYLVNRPVLIGHADCRDEAEAFREALTNDLRIENVIICDIGPVIGCHVGPGTLAVTFEIPE